MAVRLEIVPTSSNLDMYGKISASSAYSLSGHVTISLASSCFIFNRPRKTQLLLQSLELTFEGQTEINTPALSYNASRLCHFTKELAPKEALMLSNEDQDNSKEPCRWNIVFNLTIPGWLPASTPFGLENELGVSYALYATAKFLIIDTIGPRDSWSGNLSSFYSSLWSPERVIRADKPITLRRFATLPSTSIEAPLVADATYFINPSVQPVKGIKSFIPVDVWSKLQILVSVPEFVDMKSTSMPFTLRLRTKEMKEEDRKRLQFTGFCVDIMQKEKCKQRMPADYRNRYPIPPESEQPPNMPLRQSHDSSYLYDGLYIPLAMGDNEESRSFSLLSSSSNGQHDAQLPNYLFADADHEPGSWSILQSSIPLSSPDKPHEIKNDHAGRLWAGAAIRRPTCSSPLLTIRHQVTVKITLAYDHPDHGETVWEAFQFTVPIRVEHTPSRLPTPTISSSLSIFASSIMGEPISLEGDELGLGSSPPVLPPYSELFYSNGDRKLDPTPLPLYSPPGVATPNPSATVDVSRSLSEPIPATLSEKHLSSRTDPGEVFSLSHDH